MLMYFSPRYVLVTICITFSCANVILDNFNGNLHSLRAHRMNRDDGQQQTFLSNDHFQSLGQEHQDVFADDFGQQTNDHWPMDLQGKHHEINGGQEYETFNFGSNRPTKPKQSGWSPISHSNNGKVSNSNNKVSGFGQQTFPSNDHFESLGQEHQDVFADDFGQQTNDQWPIDLQGKYEEKNGGQKHETFNFGSNRPKKPKLLEESPTVAHNKDGQASSDNKVTEFGQQYVELPFDSPKVKEVPSPAMKSSSRGDQGQEVDSLADISAENDSAKRQPGNLLADFEAIHFGKKSTAVPNHVGNDIGQNSVDLPFDEGQQHVLDPFSDFEQKMREQTDDFTGHNDQKHIMFVDHPQEDDKGEFVFPDNLGNGLHQKPIPPHAAFKGGCNTRPPKPVNAVLKCTLFNGCKASCLSNYEFPSGDTSLIISCKRGEWVIAGDTWQVVPPCRPICLPGCQNNGICIAPNECECPKNFGGPQCQFEKKPCLNFPSLPANSMRSCTSRTCTVTCAPGFEFPDGSSITNLVCKDGQWALSRQDWPSLPDCKAVCDPPCINGGNCLALNTCQCPQHFTGPQCQYEMSSCSGSKLGFNGIHNCTGDGERLVCHIRCPPGIEMSSPPALDYTCFYSTGRFEPYPIPSCVYGDNVLVIPVNSNSKTFYSASQIETESYSKKGKGMKAPVEQTSWDISNLFESSGKPMPGNCLTWSGSHYKNFDGGLYSFDSPCTFTLVKDLSSYTFEILISSETCSVESCTRSLRILYQEKEYLFSSDEGRTSLFVDGKLVVIPSQLTGFTVEVSPSFTIASLTAVDVTLRWDGKEFISLDVKENMWNKTGGLCGNLNSLTTDDFVTKGGSPAHSLEEFTESWSVGDGESSCDSTTRVQSPCTEKNSPGHCDLLLNDPHFTACREAVNVKPFYEACLWDLCKCGTKCSCSTVSAFIRQCRRHFKDPSPSWRIITQCPFECFNGKLYSSCGPSEQSACGDVDLQQETTDTDLLGSCTEGCFCPPSTVLHNDTCIPRQQCPCRLRGKTFPSGAAVAKGCNTCTCMSGRWECTEIRCGARCSSVGDPHYLTFDGKRFDFMGQCTYYLLKASSFSIEAENVPCSGAISKAMNLFTGPDIPTCTKTITVRVNDRVIRLKQNSDVYVNSEEVKAFPYVDDGFNIRPVSSLFILVSLDNGVDVWWDGVTSSYIDISPDLIGKTQGLCGTFNLKQNDDFLTPEGDIEQAVVPFANKWKTDETCNEVVEKSASHPCDSNPTHRAKAVQYCAKLKSSVFTDCHWHVDVEPFYQNCLYDVCSCNTNIRACFCSVLADYASECSRESVPIVWRSEVRECGLHCYGGQTYQACGDTCTRSCQDISLVTSCRKRCVEGCNCPSGHTLDSFGSCIPVGLCPCLHHNLEYPAGHQLIREYFKGPQFCTCKNALWDCRQATSEEIKQHSEAEDVKQRCSAKMHEEFTSCEPAEPITCKNMHEPPKYSPAKCVPGCICKKGYVWDAVEKKCVRNSECPCHHGGVSYHNGKTIQQDCNTCTCVQGSWNCTERVCPSVCSTWGDSHFKTFDGLIYDFQGSCDFLLSGGSLSLSDTEVFDIKLQIVPCGTSGVSCPKSITIKVGRKDDMEEVVFTRSRPIPKAILKRISIREAGLFIFAEIFDLGVVVQWDRGTRVYVKADPKWRNKLKGLCGNMNGDEQDDFSTPSGGISEVSPVLFADSWRLQSHCPESVELRDPCVNSPHRHNWAVEKCAVLKSPVFHHCHSEVPLDAYYERCVLDTCGCDEGGDCECLCSAVAAYAHECSLRGIPIKWRSHELCPMQCDGPDNHYSSCVSPCPRRTCDNIAFHNKLAEACGEEACIEGCEGKNCPEGQLFSNNSLSECVPPTSCKALCLTVGNITYFEGDPMEGDDCHSCYCSRHEKICTGVPCSTNPTEPTLINDGKPLCVSGWTSWINVDHPFELKKKTDYEPLPSINILMLAKSPGVCNETQMSNIRCRDSWDLTNYKETKFDVECSLEQGLRCESTTVPCPDFEISVLCDCYQSTTTTTTTTTTTSSTTTARTTTTTTTTEPLPTEPSCPEGEKWVECAIPCNRTCHFFGHYLVSRGLCSSQHSCVPACQRLAWKPCPSDKWLRDGETCVLKSHCTCRSNSGDLIKPGAIFKESECAKCQCVDNSYECDLLSCFPGPTRSPSTTPSTREDSRLYNVTLPGITRHDFGNVTLIFLTTPSTVTPPPPCYEERYHSLLKGNDRAQMDASSYFDSTSTPKFGMVSGHKGSWISGSQNMDQYLQVDLGEILPVYGVIVKGNTDGYFVTSYRLLYSVDGHIYHYISTPEKINELFRGPINGVDGVKQILPKPIETRYLRFNPFTWHEAIAMKVDILGCGGEVESTTEWSHEVTTTTPLCIDPMGVGSELTPVAILVSSEQPGFSHYEIPIASTFSWKPLINSPAEWVMIDFQGPRNVTGIVTKGLPQGNDISSPVVESWVQSYRIVYSHDGENWNPILDVSHKERVFLGNFDGDTEVTNYFDLPINMRYLKLFPLSWHTNVALRLEVLGCYQPYNLPPVLTTSESPKGNCKSCPGLEVPLVCPCTDQKWWNGENCIERSDCPCFVGHITYDVGSIYANEKCEECICRLNGVPICARQKCGDCPAGLRSEMTPSCRCTCIPCEIGTRICPTSGICIPEEVWCDGVHDCPDDETGCISYAEEPIKCNNTCPPGYAIVFSSSPEEVEIVEALGSKGIKKGTNLSKTSKGRSKNIKSQKRPPMKIQESVATCPPFDCVPLPTLPPVTTPCPAPSCPVNFKLEQKDITVLGACPRYTCRPPPEVAVCTLSDRTFTTFDNVEYKYDVCHHILVTPLDEKHWNLTVYKTCKSTAPCGINIAIVHGPARIDFLENLSLLLNGFQYDVPQINLINENSQDYNISRIGDSLIFVSNIYHFKVTFSSRGTIRIEVSGELKNGVGGLCGFYNGNPDDDKTMPDGSLSRSTGAFGRGWAVTGEEACDTRACPLTVQEAALDQCYSIRKDPFTKCADLINTNHFISKCLEATCSCLIANHSLEECRCAALQDYVTSCKNLDMSRDLSSWHLEFDCTPKCPPGQIFHECYPYSCEPSCLNTDCFSPASSCLPGCFCPDGLIRSGDACVKPSECRDCVCDGFGDSLYKNFDGQNFTFNGNCSYLLARDVTLSGAPNFQVIATHSHCKEGGQTQCAKEIVVYTRGHSIRLKAISAKKVIALADDIEVTEWPASIDWAVMEKTSDTSLQFLLPALSLQMSYRYPSFTISIPSHVYRNRTEGICGNCNRNPLDDNIKSSDLNDLWLVKSGVVVCKEETPQCDHPGGDTKSCDSIRDAEIYRKCHPLIDPEPFIHLCQSHICFNGSACESIEAYAKACRDAGICIDWRTPSFCPMTCSKGLTYFPCHSGCQKTCENFMNVTEVCPFQNTEGCFCPDGQVHVNETCVNADWCHTCDDKGHHVGDKWNVDKCTNCSCEKTGTKCSHDECSAISTICSQGFSPVLDETTSLDCCPKFFCIPNPANAPIKCNETIVPECGIDQVLEDILDAEGCPSHVCRCIPRDSCHELQMDEAPLPIGMERFVNDSGCCPSVEHICIASKCPPPPNCQTHYKLLTYPSPHCCPTFVCEKPKDICIYELHHGDPTVAEDQLIAKEVGSKWSDGHCTSCVCERSSSSAEAVCTVRDCPTIEHHPDHQEYDLTATPGKDACCPDIVRVGCKGPDGRAQKIGESWYPFKGDLCTTAHCVSHNTNGIVKEIRIETCASKCDPGWEYKLTNDSCCGQCVQVACVLETTIYKPGDSWNSKDNCTKYTCLNVLGGYLITSEMEKCPDLVDCAIEDQYQDGCCVKCRPSSISQSNCAPTDVKAEETVHLIQELQSYHGKCLNQEPVKGFKKCSGACDSYTMYNPATWNHENFCQCCQATAYAKVKVPLTCEDGYVIEKAISIPSKCKCQACGGS